MEITWLEATRVKDLNRKALYEGENHDLNRGADLEGIVYRPQSWAHYKGVRSLHKLAALYAVAIVEGHPFQDGNKRTALLAAYTFLDLNELELSLEKEDEIFDLITTVAETDEEVSKSADSKLMQELTDWVRRNTEGGCVPEFLDQLGD